LKCLKCLGQRGNGLQKLLLYLHQYYLLSRLLFR
jgi:hypothetical protein